MGRADERRRIVERFNDCITRADPAGLGALMTDDHRFVDSAGQEWSGRDTCLETWAGFFDAFPGYRNVLASVHSTSDDVVATGRSECVEPGLDGPAIWTATVAGDRVAEWRVYDDTTAVRAALGVPTS
ncbi:MAG: nuclear transport factor 2 family protein [Nocardioidaceae bacterium]